MNSVTEASPSSAMSAEAGRSLRMIGEQVPAVLTVQLGDMANVANPASLGCFERAPP